MTYIVVSENEVVKAEMERPNENNYYRIDGAGIKFLDKDAYYRDRDLFTCHIASLPRIAAPGHKWKVWDEVEQYKDFHIGWQIRWTVDSEWRNSDVFDYYNRTDENLRRIIAIPIQPTPEGEKVEIQVKVKKDEKWEMQRRIEWLEERVAYIEKVLKIDQ